MSLTSHRPGQELIDLVGALSGTWHGYTAMCRCPAHADRTPSLSLRQGDTSILVTCFAGCRPADILYELRRVPCARHFDPPPAPPGPRRANVERLWEEAGPADLGLAWRYLSGRGFARVPPDVRFHPRCPHGARPHTVFRPAILVAVREGRRLSAVQRIFLDPATAWHAGKAMLGRPGTGAWQGRIASTVLAFAEGFETAEAYAVLHDRPCWASLGAGRLARVALPSSVVDLLIAGDNDDEGRRAAARAQEHYARPGLRVRADYPPPGHKDWAEVLELRLKREGGLSG